MAKNTWQEMKMNHAIRGFAVVVTGIIMTAFLLWFFGGFGFWELPGLAILFIGVAEIFYTIYMAYVGKKSTWIHMGLLVLFIGISIYGSLAGHVMLGTLQMISLVVMVIGILLLIVGIVSHPKT